MARGGRRAVACSNVTDVPFDAAVTSGANIYKGE